MSSAIASRSSDRRCRTWNLRFTGPLELRVEAAELRCDSAERGHIICTWTARYGLHNPGDARTLDIAIGHVAGADVTLTLDDGQRRDTTHTRAADLATQRRAVDRREQAQTVVTWPAAAAGDATLIVDATFLVSPWTCPCQYPTNKRRHRWVTRWRSSEYFVNYRPGDQLSAAPPTYSLVHDIPARWSGDFFHGPDHGKDRREGRRRIARVTRARPTDDDYDEGGRITAQRPLRFEAGGPIVAAGRACASAGSSSTSSAPGTTTPPSAACRTRTTAP